MAAPHPARARRSRTRRGGSTPTTSPYAQEDYRALIKAWRREKPKGRSCKAIALRLGISKSWISMICKGTRDLPLSDVSAWADLMGLEAAERRYFDALVRQRHAPTVALRTEAAWEAAAARALARATSDAARAELAPLFRSVHAQVLLELDRLGVAPDPAVLHPPATQEELERAAVAYTLAAGRLELSTEARVSDPRVAAGVRDLHRDALENSARALDEDAPETYQFGSLVVALPTSGLPAIELRIRQAILTALSPWADGEGADRVFQLSVQVVARTSKLQEGST